jgi:hypothetical protein
MNTNRKISFIAWIVAVIFFIGIFIPSIIGIDGMNGGFALSFVLGFFSIVAIITAFVYGKLAKEYDAIMKGKDVLAHWQYAPDEWKDYTAKEFTRDKKDKRSLFLIVFFWSALFAISFPILDHKNGWYVTIVMGILIIIIGITAIISIISAHRSNKKSNGDVYITKHGILFSGKVLSWSMISSKLLDVRLDEVEEPPLLVFEIQSGKSSYTLRIPVPQGKKDEAKKIIQMIDI